MELQKQLYTRIFGVRLAVDAVKCNSRLSNTCFTPMQTATITSLDYPMLATIDITVDGFAEDYDELICSYPAVENITGGFVTVHSS